MPPARGQRRRPEEIRALILEAARELFESQGYDATTTKDIARRAGVLESLLFTNFGSKAGLFDAAVVGPFSELVGSYVEAWDRHSAESTPEARLDAFLDGLFDLAEQHRTLLIAAFVRRGGEDAGDADLLDHLAQTLHRIERIRAVADYPEVDAPVSISVLAATVFGLVLLDDMLFPRGARRPSRARIVKEMKQTIAFGILHRPRS